MSMSELVLLQLRSFLFCFELGNYYWQTGQNANTVRAGTKMMRTGEGVLPTGVSNKTNDSKKLMLCFSLMEKPIGELELGDCIVIAKPDAQF